MPEDLCSIGEIAKTEGGFAIFRFLGSQMISLFTTPTHLLHAFVCQFDSRLLGPCRYPWMQLAGEERKAAVEERRKDLLRQILAIDAPVEGGDGG